MSRERGDASREAVMEELRALGLLALDRLDPLVGRLSETVSAAAEGDAAAAHRCTACPVCAALAEAGTGRADALAEVARHAAGLLAALRVALTETGPADPSPEPARPERVVQHIPVERTPSC